MNPVTQRAIDAASRYEQFTDGLVRQFEIALQNDPTDARVRDQANGVARAQAVDYLDNEADVIGIDTQSFATSAYEQAAEDAGHATVSLPEELADHWEQTGQHLRETLAAQASRDIAALSQEIQVAAIRASTAARAGQSPQAALAAMLVDHAQGPRFRFTDRMGRRFAATKHVRDQYRQHLVLSQNEAVLYAAAEAGLDTVTIRHPEPRHRWNGHVVTTGEGEGDSYYDIRDEVFHPSTDAYLSVE